MSADMTARRARGEYLVGDRANSARCTSCGADILWIITPKGKRMPLSEATIRMDENGRQWALTHFANCPHAAKHRAVKER